MSEAEPTRQRLLKIPDTIMFGLRMSSALRGERIGTVVTEAAQLWLESDQEVFDYIVEPRTQLLLRSPACTDREMRYVAAETDTSLNALYYSASVNWLINQTNNGADIFDELQARHDSFLPKLDVLTRK